MKYSCKLSALQESDIISVPVRKARPTRYRTPSQLPVQNQGDSPYCVPYSIMECLNFYGRLRNLRPKVTIEDIYECRADKEAEGMQAKEAFQFLKDKGEIKGFGRITSLDQLQCSLFINGPSLIVLPVYNNETKFWKGEDLLGYHAVSCIGYESGYLVIKNSWGNSYGSHGFANLPIAEANSCIKEIWTITI